MTRTLFLVTIFISLSFASLAQAEHLESEDFLQRLGKNGAQLIDVRTSEEFAKGHLVGAKNIDWLEDGFMEKANKLDKTKPVLLYCAAGGRSEEALTAMQEAGFKLAVDLKHGYNGWKRANLPTTTK